MLRPFSMPAILQPAPIRKRLWQGGIALAILVITLAATNQLIAPEKSVSPAMLGHDFMPFYTAGSFVRQGAAHQLYDLDAVKSFELALAADNHLEMGKGFGPYWNPPFYAWIFAPLSMLPYREALFVWTMCNVAALLVAISMMRRMLGVEVEWRTTALVPLLVLVSMPFIQAISHAQNTFGSLLLVASVAMMWRARRAVPAGAICGLLLYKPQLAVVLAIVMALDLGWRVLLGIGSVGAGLLLVTSLTLPGTIEDYLVNLPANLHFMQIENTYLWERHATIKAFWRLLLQGRSAGEIAWSVSLLTGICCALIGGGLLMSILKLRRDTPANDNPWSGDTSARRRDRLIAATIAATPLLMPFYFDYDLLLLAVPAVLLSGELIDRPIGSAGRRADRWLIRAWCGLFLWLMINPGLANTTHVNMTVILLASVAGLSIRRVIRRDALPMVASRRESLRMAVQRVAA